MLAQKTFKFLAAFCDGLAGLFYPNICQLCHNEVAIRAQGYVGSECRKKVKVIKPPYCDRCGQPFFGEILQSFVCENCMNNPLAFTSARSVCHFEGPIRDAIHRYKYEGAMWIEPFLAEMLVETAQPVLSQENWDAIIPVPLFSARKRQREFNQAERLADHLGRALGIPVLPTVLRRTRPTLSQTTLDRKKRSENMKNAFAIHRLPKNVLHRVILIDDVLTTGATANECAIPLLAQGIEKVVVWTVARTKH